VAPVTDEQRSALLAAKLRALTAHERGDSAPVLDLFPGGVAAREGQRGWFLADAEPLRTLGPALAWARKHGVTELHVVADAPEVAAIVARRASAFVTPPSVWSVHDDRLVRAQPAPFGPLPEWPTGVETLVALVEAAGAEIVCEHGQLVAEVQGLEVGRIVVGSDGPHLEVGVGRHDREAFGLVHAELPTPEALASVVGVVRQHRRPGAAAHPLNQLAASRWLRAMMADRPDDLGFASLEPRALTHEREGVKARHPAAAVGVDRAGRPAVVVFSVGVDLDLVPTAADVRLHERQQRTETVERLVLVLPERDVVAATRAQAEALSEPAEIVAIDDAWRR
jgi:hypothetical protein